MRMSTRTGYYLNFLLLFALYYKSDLFIYLAQGGGEQIEVPHLWQPKSVNASLWSSSSTEFEHLYGQIEHDLFKCIAKLFYRNLNLNLYFTGSADLRRRTGSGIYIRIRYIQYIYTEKDRDRQTDMQTNRKRKRDSLRYAVYRIMISTEERQTY